MQWSFYLVLGAVHTTDAVSERKGAPRYPSRKILGFTCKLTSPGGGGGGEGSSKSRDPKCRTEDTFWR